MAEVMTVIPKTYGSQSVARSQNSGVRRKTLLDEI